MDKVLRMQYTEVSIFRFRVIPPPKMNHYWSFVNRQLCSSRVPIAWNRQLKSFVIGFQHDGGRILKRLKVATHLHAWAYFRKSWVQSNRSGRVNAKHSFYEVCGPRCFLSNSMKKGLCQQNRKSRFLSCGNHGFRYFEGCDRGTMGGNSLVELRHVQNQRCPAHLSRTSTSKVTKELVPQPANKFHDYRFRHFYQYPSSPNVRMRWYQSRERFPI